VENPANRFGLVVILALVLGFSGNSEDEDDDENEENGVLRVFPHRL
jgi:hypothetical protein